MRGWLWTKRVDKPKVSEELPGNIKKDYEGEKQICVHIKYII